MRVKPTFYYCLLKRTHNLGLDGGLNFRWQYNGMGYSYKKHR